MFSNSNPTSTIRQSKADWDQTFSIWAQGPSTTEQERCDNAVRMITAAIRDHDALRNRSTKVFAQGSYRNRTNIRKQSDVDICVLCTDTFFPDYSQVPGVSNDTLGFSDASYGFDELKRDVESALVAKFGRAAVKPGDKAFDVHETGYRVDSDVVPAFEGRLYYRDYFGVLRFHSGTVLRCDSDGRRIKNWPEQHYANGVDKHTGTYRQFKKKARILKNLAVRMTDAGIDSADKMASFLLESLVYNCPNDLFAAPSHYEAMLSIIAHLWKQTSSDELAADMLEVNGIKYLFHYEQAWNRTDTNKFLFDAWHYMASGE